MSLVRTLQSKHTFFVGRLIAWAYEQGYELTGGEYERSVLQAMANAHDGKGIANSLHLIKLAIDFALFRDGVNLTKFEDWLPLGEFWESLDPLCAWGGRFHSPDCDHFSITYGGVR